MFSGLHIRVDVFVNVCALTRAYMHVFEQGEKTSPVHPTPPTDATQKKKLGETNTDQILISLRSFQFPVTKLIKPSLRKSVRCDQRAPITYAIPCSINK